MAQVAPPIIHYCVFVRRWIRTSEQEESDGGRARSAPKTECLAQQTKCGESSAPSCSRWLGRITSAFLFNQTFRRFWTLSNPYQSPATRDSKRALKGSGWETLLPSLTCENVHEDRSPGPRSHRGDRLYTMWCQKCKMCLWGYGGYSGRRLEWHPRGSVKVSL